MQRLYCRLFDDLLCTVYLHDSSNVIDFFNHYEGESYKNWKNEQWRTMKYESSIFQKVESEEM